MNKCKCICLHKNLLLGIFFLAGLACSVWGERPENEDALGTRVLHYQAANSTSVPPVYEDEAALNVSHYISEALTTTLLPKSTDVQVSTNKYSPSLQTKSEHRNDTQDNEHSSQTHKEINSGRFEINTSFNVSELEHQDNEEYIQTFTTVVTGKVDQADFQNTHAVESFSYDSMGTHYNTKSTSIAPVLLTELVNHSLNSTSMNQAETRTHNKTVVQMNDTQISQIYDADQLITTVAPEVHHTTDMNINEEPYVRVIFDHNLELIINSTDRSLIAGDLLDFAGIHENILVPDADGNHTSLENGMGHLHTSMLSDQKQTNSDTDSSYVATTDVVDEVTITNQANSVEDYVTLAGQPVLGTSSVLSRDETDKNMFAVTSRTGQEMSPEADLISTIMDFNNYTLTKSVTISETTEMYTNLVPHIESESPSGYETFQASNQSGSNNLWRTEEEIQGNTTSKEQGERNCESQQGCEGKNTESKHLDILVTSPISTPTGYYTTEFLSGETVIRAHGTSSSEEGNFENVDFVNATTTKIYTVPPVLIGEVSSMNHHNRSTSVTSVTETENPSSLLTVTTGSDSETISSIVSTSSGAEVLAFSDDIDQKALDTSITSSKYHQNLMNYSSIVREHTARIESLSDDQQPDERTATGNGGTPQQVTSFDNEHSSKFDAASSPPVDINPTLSTGTFMSEYDAHKNAPLRIDYTSHTSSPEFSYSDNFNSITTAENAHIAVYEITETVNELSLQAENNTESPAVQNTKSGEFYDMAITYNSENEQNNLMDSYTASISYKMTSGSPLLSSIKTSFGESLPTDVPIKEMNISSQISTQSHLPSTSEILFSSSNSSFPEISTETVQSFKYFPQESQQALSRLSESMVLDKHIRATDSDIISLPNNQSLRTADPHNSFGESLSTEVSNKEMNASLQISPQFLLHSTSEILSSSSHFTLPELSYASAHPLEFLSQESQFSESMVSGNYSHVEDSGITLMPNNQSLRSTDLHNSFGETLPTEVSTKGMNISLLISTPSPLPSTSGTLPSSSHFSLPELPTERSDPLEYLVHRTELPVSQFTESTTDPDIVLLPTNQSSTGLHNSPSEEVVTVSLKEIVSLEARIQASSDSEITSFSMNQATTLLTFAGTSPAKEISISSLSSVEKSPLFSESTRELVTTEHYTFSGTEVLSLSSQQKSEIPAFSSTRKEKETSTVQISHSAVNSSFHSSEKMDHVAVTTSIPYIETDSITAPTDSKELSEISEDRSTSEVLLDSSKSTVEYVLTNTSEGTSSPHLTTDLYFSQNHSTFTVLQKSVQSTVGSIIHTVADNSIKTFQVTNVSLSANDFSFTSTILEESAATTTSLGSIETLPPRSREILTSTVNLTSDDTATTNMATSMEANRKEKESTFAQDYSSHFTHERMESKGTEISTTEHTTHKYTQEFLTTQFKALISQKEFQSLTTDEMNNTITVVFKVKQEDEQWIDLYTKRFSEWMVKMLLAEIKEHKMKTPSSDTSGFQGTTTASPIRIELIYVFPTPYVVSENLIFTFFALIAPDNDTIPLSKLIDALLSDTEGMQNCMNLNLSYFIRGQYLMPNGMDNWTSLNQVWQKYGVLLLTISILTLLIVVILIAAVVYLRCKSRRSVTYISDKDKLHRDLNDSTEIGDLNRGSVILHDEVYGKDTSLVNGNHVLTIGDDEGWLVPINDVPVEDQDAPDVQDTKL